jgi:hypothetical protein
MNAIQKKIHSKALLIILGAILTLFPLLPVSINLFGSTGYVTEITRTERIRRDDDGRLDAYLWEVGYKFRMKDGEITTGSVQVKGAAYSPKSGLRVGSPIRYFALRPGFNTPGEGKLDTTTFMFLFVTAVGVFLIRQGVRKPKAANSQR